MCCTHGTAPDLEPEAMSVIVQGPYLATARAAGRIVGGEITHELGIIRAVGALLASEQRERLESRPGVVVYENRELKVVTTGGLSTVRDEFNSRIYYGNDGTDSWADSWQEIGESDGPTSGYVEVDDSSRCASGNCLELDGRSGRGIWRTADLDGAGSATLTFSYRRRDADDGDGTVVLHAGDGGSSWHELTSYSLRDDDHSQQSASFDISSWAGPDTRIRLLSTAWRRRRRIPEDLRRRRPDRV